MSGVPFIIKDKDGGKKFVVGTFTTTTVTIEYKDYSDNCTTTPSIKFVIPTSVAFSDPGGNFSISPYLSGQSSTPPLYAGQTYYPQVTSPITTPPTNYYLIQTKAGSDVYNLAPITSNPGVASTFGLKTYAIGDYDWNPELTLGITTNFGQITFYNVPSFLTGDSSILFDFGIGCQDLAGQPVNLSVAQCTGTPPNSCAVCGPPACVPNYTCTSVGGGPCTTTSGCNCVSTTATGATLFTFGLRWTNTNGTVYVLTYSTPSGGKTGLFAVPENAVPTQDISGPNFNTGSNTNGTVPSEKWFTVIVPSGQTSLQSGIAYPVGIVTSNGSGDVVQYLNKDGTTSYSLESSPGTSNFTLTPQNNVDWFDYGLTSNSLSNADFIITGGNSTTGTSFTGTIALWNTSAFAGQAAVGENPITITSPVQGQGFSLNINTPFSLPLTATGGSGTGYQWTVSGLPPGLCLLLPNGNCVSPDTQTSPNGLISGTPSSSIVIPPSSNFAQYFATIGVTDSDGNSTSNTIELDVFASTSLAIVTTTLPNAFVGNAYTATLVGSGGTTPYTWAVTGLPPNLTLDATTGVISGTATTAGSSTINVTLTDSSTPMQTATTTLTLTVVQPGSTTLTLSPTTLPEATTNQAYSQTITVPTTGATPPFTWTIPEGTLPSQFSTNPPIGGQGNNLVISGTPTSVETETFTLQVVDGNNNLGQQSYTLTVNQPGVSIVVSPTSLPGGIVGTTYNQVITASPALSSGNYTWSVSSGSLPPGVTGSSTSSNTFTLTGNPTTAGTSSFTLVTTDPSGNTTTTPYSITITAASTPPPPTAVPFYRQWWFWVIIAVVVILIIILIVYFSTRRR